MGPVQLSPVVPRAPAADVDVDEVEVIGQSRGLHGVGDRAVQQADTWKGRERSRGCLEEAESKHREYVKKPYFVTTLLLTKDEDHGFSELI